jgi:hypothetical protein
MNPKSPIEKKIRFSRFRVISLILIGIAVVIIISLLYLGQNGDETTPSVCGEDCHEDNYLGYNDPQVNSFMEAHLETNVECWYCHIGEDVKDKSNEPHGEITPTRCMAGCHVAFDWKLEDAQGEEFWHPHTENGTNLDILENVDSCINCHDARTN